MTGRVVRSARGPRAETAWPPPGTSVQAWRYGVLHHQGVVEDVMHGSGVLWIREDGLGVRKMIDLQEYSLRPCRPRPAGTSFPRGRVTEVATEG